MNDFTMILLALGRGIIKLLISIIVGFGVALLVIGIVTASQQDHWHGSPSTGAMFMGIGAGLLCGGGTLFALFFLPWFSKRPPERGYADEPPILARPAPRPMRYEHDNEARPAPKPARLDPDDSMPPTVRPIPPPPDEPDRFFEK